MDQIIDISQNGRHVSRDRGFLKVDEQGKTIGLVPFDQIAAVLVHAHGITWSNSVLIELAARGIPVVLCAANHEPKSVLMPIEGHHAQGARMRAQWNASEPFKKRPWQRMVTAKIKTQAAALQSVGQPRTALDHNAAKVQSGDTGNAEAQAARTYWLLLLGPEFRRDPRRPDINALLNYGYTVLLAACARAVIGAGLHPTIGLFHTNRSNAFALVDDLMKPFRPLVDLTARPIAAVGVPTLRQWPHRHWQDSSP